MQRAVLSSIIIMILAFLSPLRAEEPNALKGKAEHLAKYIGSYEVDEFINEETVQTALKAVLPAARIKNVKDNLGVRGPIEFIEGHLVASGNMPRNGDAETVQVWIKIYDSSAKIALKTKGKMAVYAKEAAYEYLPLYFRAHVAGLSFTDHRQPPRDVNWVR